MNLYENIEVPLRYRGIKAAERKRRIEQCLEQVGLASRAKHLPQQLSGGQQQRVSVARALINGAEVILADEPTGALDSASGEQLLALLRELHAEGVTIILITHDSAVAEHADRQIHLLDGKIVTDTKTAAPSTSESVEKNAASVQHVHSQEPTPVPAIKPFPSISLFSALSMAFTALRMNWFRTLLTLLGIIIGVAVVLLIEYQVSLAI